MKRIGLSGVALVMLAACQPVVPDSGANVLTSMRGDAQRDAQLAQSPVQVATVQPPAEVAATSLDPAAQPLPSSVIAAVDPAEAAAARQAASDNSGVAPLDADPSNPAPAIVNDAGISAEQDFDAVSSQRSIQSDADRIANNRAQYTLIQPTDLPKRQGTKPAKHCGIRLAHHASSGHATLFAGEFSQCSEALGRLSAVLFTGSGADRVSVTRRTRTGPQGAGPGWGWLCLFLESNPVQSGTGSRV